MNTNDRFHLPPGDDAWNADTEAAAFAAYLAQHLTPAPASADGSVLVALVAQLTMLLRRRHALQRELEEVYRCEEVIVLRLMFAAENDASGFGE
jgi:hypothetical protein